MPEISILLPVYNSAKFLGEAVDSVLVQTFDDFECIIIDDGSTDGSQDIVHTYRDSRIIFIQNQENIGVARTLNKGIDLARGHFIARMDADDTCKIDRLHTQRNFFHQYPDAGLCGTWVKMCQPKHRNYILRFPVDYATLRPYTLFNNPLAHPSVMWRVEEFKKHRLRYDETYAAGQDYELWARCMDCFPVYNIPKVLLDWRLHEQGVTHRCFDKSNDAAMAVQRRELEALGLFPASDELLFHRRTGNAGGSSTVDVLRQGSQWLLKLIEKNDTILRYDSQGMQRASSLVWFRMCSNSTCLGLRALRVYFSVPMLRCYRPPLLEMAFFFAKALLWYGRKVDGGFLGSISSR